MVRISNTATAAQVAAFKGQVALDPRKRWAPYASHLEVLYAERLEINRKAGMIKHWQYEPIKLRLGHRCFYTPDFLVVHLDGSVGYYEVKGYMRDDARVKLSVAAARYPETFWLVTRKAGAWNVALVPKEPG